MSETTTTTSGPASIPQDKTATISKLAVSILTQLLFLSAFGVAYLLKNDTAINLLVGAVIANATTTVNFWLGSSSGSSSKDATIAQMAQPSVTVTKGTTS